ncbi:MAG: hypothetical protein ACLGIR_01460 [Actinomycetes bacterium]
METVPLRSYRLAPRRSRIELDGATAHLRLPGWFGRRVWSVPIRTAAVIDLTDDADGSVLSDEVVFARRLRIPYLWTTGPATAPTIALLFAEPQRIPPLRWMLAFASGVDLPVGIRASRSAAGATLDGVLLRAVDPEAAVASLVAGGAERVTEAGGVAWLAARRQLRTDPAEVAALEEAVAALEGRGRIAAVTLWVGLGLWAATAVLDTLLDGRAPGGALGAGLALGLVLVATSVVRLRQVERAADRLDRPDA